MISISLTQQLKLDFNHTSQRCTRYGQLVTCTQHKAVCTPQWTSQRPQYTVILTHLVKKQQNCCYQWLPDTCRMNASNSFLADPMVSSQSMLLSPHCSDVLSSSTPWEHCWWAFLTAIAHNWNALPLHVTSALPPKLRRLCRVGH